MANKSKLTEEIKQFIILQKRLNPALSCRGLIPLINAHFQMELSKSLINSVLKGNNLSGPKGRRMMREPITVQPVSQVMVEPQITAQRVTLRPGIRENGGCFFLKVAELKLNLSFKVAEVIRANLPDLPTFQIQEMVETLIYQPVFKDVVNLEAFLERSFSKEYLEYPRQFASVPFPQLQEQLAKLGFKHNINNINELCKECLWRLNSYIVTFFPPEYQFLDFEAMQKQFYSLPARIEKNEGLLSVQLFYPEGFLWLNDIIWQEGFSYAVHKINQAGARTRDNRQIWFNPQPQFFPENASF